MDIYTCNRQRLDIERLEILDAHSHLGAWPPISFVRKTPAEMVRTMDRVGVAKITASHLMAIGPDVDQGNRLTAEAMRAFPDRILGYYVVDARRPAGLRERLEDEFLNNNWIGLKFHPYYHGYPADGPNWNTALEFANHYGMPVLSHQWASPGQLEQVSGDFPQISFIEAHGELWDSELQRGFLEVTQRRQNVYVDLCSSKSKYRFLETAVARYGSKRLLFASDFPFLDLAYQLGRVVYADIPLADRDAILSLNFRELLESSWTWRRRR